MAAQHQTDRTLIARQGAHTKWAKTSDRTAATAPARRGLRAKFEREIDPEGVLPPAELDTRVRSAISAHMSGLARVSAQRRRRRAA